MKNMFLKLFTRFLVVAMTLTMAIPAGQAQELAEDVVQPIVFQAAGPTIESIQGTVDATALLWEIPTMPATLAH